MSVGYTDEQGTTIETGLKKINISTSLDYDISTKLQFRTDIMFTRYDQQSIPDPYLFGGVRGIAYRKMPNMSVYERDTLGNILGSYFTPIETIQGTGANMYNPVAYANQATSRSLRDNTRAAFGIKYKMLPNLYYDGTITFDIFDNNTASFIPFEAIGYVYQSTLTNRSIETYSKTSRINTNNKVVYTPMLGNDHELVLLALLETESSNEREFSKQTSLSASPYLRDAAGNILLNQFGTKSSKSRSMGTYVSANYKFKDRYLVSTGLRYEGSSKLSKESRFGYFPMATMAWRISEEPFMARLHFIDDFKIRGSWGLSGNMPDGNYLYYNTYSASAQYGYMGISGVRPDGIELTSLRWETIEQFSPGLSFFAFNYKLNIEFDVYQKLTHDLYLKDSKIPTTAGFTAINQNGGEMMNQGWELMIDATFLQNKNWKISTNFNISHNENIVLSLPENISLETYNMENNGVYGTKIEPGTPLGNFTGYEYVGAYVDADDVVVKDKDGNAVYNIDGTEKLMMQHASGYEFEAGDAKYVDQNYDGVIDELDVVKLGDYNPKLMGGIGPRIQYKNITFNLFLYYRLGQDIINGTRIGTENMRGHDNQSKATNRRWRSPGDVTEIPRALYGKGYNYLGSSRFVEEASFLRLKTMSISYNLSSKVCKKLNVRDIKIFSTAYNLFTWTNYTGQDPEVGFGNPIEIPKDNSRTPPGRRITMGLNIKF
jgi:TonB-linked SusC/RagA family outer membrane protein